MGSYKAKAFFALLIIVLSISQVENKFSIEWTPKYEVHVINNLPPNSAQLRIHCASKDNDLGYHDLAVNDDFHWHFHGAMLGDTLYFCHFWWGNNDKRFDVFQEVRGSGCGTEGRKNGVCSWIVKEDGFYEVNHAPPVNPSELAKRYGWT